MVWVQGGFEFWLSKEDNQDIPGEPWLGRGESLLASVCNLLSDWLMEGGNEGGQKFDEIINLSMGEFKINIKILTEGYVLFCPESLCQFSCKLWR